jgi:uncharacterized protein DUF4214
MRLVLCGLAILGLALMLWPHRPAREAAVVEHVGARVARGNAAAVRIPEAASAHDGDAALPAGGGVKARVPAAAIATTPKLAMGAPTKTPSALETSRALPPAAAAHPSRPASPASPAPPSAPGERENAMAPVARLYLAYFQRLPDIEGFEHYVDQRDGGRPLAAIADEFAGSREFAQRYGDVNDAQFLDLIAQNLFEGELDRNERAQWLAELDAGNVTRGEVMLALSEGGAFRAASNREVATAIRALLRARHPR